MYGGCQLSLRDYLADLWFWATLMPGHECSKVIFSCMTAFFNYKWHGYNKYFRWNNRSGTRTPSGQLLVVRRITQDAQYTQAGLPSVQETFVRMSTYNVLHVCIPSYRLSSTQSGQLWVVRRITYDTHYILQCQRLLGECLTSLSLQSSL